jgi:hypothetical protein
LLLEEVMPTIIKYIKQPDAFDPETLSVMGAAYERALSALSTSPPKSVREVIATHIINGAHAGERNPDRLCQLALATLRVEADE